MTTAASPPLVVRVRRVEGAPVVAVRVWVRGGSRAEPAPGVALVSGRLLAEGTRRRDWRRIAEEAEELGMSIAAAAGYECQSLALDGLAADWRRALEWAAELTLEASFPDERCRWIAEQTHAELEGLADHPDVVGEWAFRRQLYDPHPRGRPLQGTVESLATVTGEACRDFHRRCLAGGVIVTVAGAIDPRPARRLAEELFGTAEAAGVEADAVRPPTIEGLDARQEVRLLAGDQAHLFLGGLTVRRDDPRLAALDLLAVVLGSGSGLMGRIPRRVRELDGLAYACRAATTIGAGLEPGRCEVYLATARERAARAEQAAREELERLAGEGVAETELEAARAFLLGREPFRRETARQWAALLAEAALYALPLDRPRWVRRQIEAVTTADLERATAEFLDPAGLKLTLAAPS